jgi:hypothetical protein
MAELLLRLLLAILLGLVVALPLATIVFLGCLWSGRTWQESWLSAGEIAAHVVGDVLTGGLN